MTAERPVRTAGVVKTNIAFVGGRGAGKSRLSRKFGKMTGRSVLSTDNLISYESKGLSIAALVAKNGWADFRKREYKVLKKVAAMRDVVIDCGGGILVEAPARPNEDETFSQRKAKLLRKSAIVVYVKRDMDWLLDKARQDAQRPALSDGSYRQLLERRLPWYEKLADLVLDMTDMEVETGVDILIAKFGRI